MSDVIPLLERDTTAHTHSYYRKYGSKNCLVSVRNTPLVRASHRFNEICLNQRISFADLFMKHSAHRFRKKMYNQLREFSNYHIQLYDVFHQLGKTHR